MLFMRSREEAEGERRMIGSRRRAAADEGFEDRWTRAGLFESAGVGAGTFGPGRLRDRLMNVSAVLRTWEKSYETMSDRLRG